MSWKMEVQADSSGTWASNAVRLETREEAEAYGLHKFQTWTLVTSWRVVETPDDPANYRWLASKLEPLVS